MQARPRILFAVLDAFPFDRVDEANTPVLARLANEGGWARHGGRSVLSASTYPNFASLITGTTPAEHGIFTGKAWTESGLVPAAKAGPATPTLFDDCKAAGIRSVAAVGDQNLVGVCRATQADAHWPPAGKLPEDAPRGLLGYGADRGVVESLQGLNPSGADFLFIQLDEVDTARHLNGPWNTEVEKQCHQTDAALGQIIEQVRENWNETIAIVVSDHDHESVDPGAIDLGEYAQDQGLDLEIDHDGTAAVISGSIDQAQLLAFPGVRESCEVGPGKHLVWGDPGQQFGIDWKLAAQHGSPRTERQLAVVGGGHPHVLQLTQAIQETPPPCTSWAWWIRKLLRMPDPAAT